MGMNNRVIDKPRKPAEDRQDPGNSTGFEKVKNIIAEKLHKVAEVPGEKAADQDEQFDLAQYGKQASEWLEKSAEYVRQFDYEQADARVREYVTQGPGRSLLIAGAVGLVIGAILRRR
jgi:ElaB/YqjD/DUF883 family membrane-anchored ribosome-binding protein